MPDNQSTDIIHLFPTRRNNALDRVLPDFGKPYSRNIRIEGHRTTIRLESEVWDALDEIAHRERASINELCTMIAGSAPANELASFTSALRVFIIAYYRMANRLEGTGRA